MMFHGSALPAIGFHRVVLALGKTLQGVIR
jgi:hypothetical protein